MVKILPEMDIYCLSDVLLGINSCAVQVRAQWTLMPHHGVGPNLIASSSWGKNTFHRILLRFSLVTLRRTAHQVEGARVLVEGGEDIKLRRGGVYSSFFEPSHTNDITKLMCYKTYDTKGRICNKFRYMN